MGGLLRPGHRVKLPPAALIILTLNDPSRRTKSSFLRLLHPRETIELVFLLGSGVAIVTAAQKLGDNEWLTWLVVLWAALKTAYYFGESLWHLVQATASDLPYHRFLLLMSYNMAEVTISFAIDFYCLQQLSPRNFSGIQENLTGVSLMFECLYFSILNFSFFGYGDITPATVPAKIVMLLEVVTAFTTVIFLISDFVSMKDSMKRERL
jgi:hypothetical protein